MNPVDVFMILVPVAATAGMCAAVIHVLQRITSSAGAWVYWVTLALALTCLALPWRFGIILPQLGSLSPDANLRSITLDALLQAGWAAIAVVLARRARHRRQQGRRIASRVIEGLSWMVVLLVAWFLVQQYSGL